MPKTVLRTHKAAMYKASRAPSGAVLGHSVVLNNYPLSPCHLPSSMAIINNSTRLLPPGKLRLQGPRASVMQEWRTPSQLRLVMLGHCSCQPTPLGRRSSTYATSIPNTGIQVESFITNRICSVPTGCCLFQPDAGHPGRSGRSI